MKQSKDKNQQAAATSEIKAGGVLVWFYSVNIVQC